MDHSKVSSDQLIERMGDAIVVSDPKGKITLWNPAAEHLFGFSEAEALGESLDIIIPENQRDPHWEGYFHTMDTGKTKYGNDVLKVPAINKAGDRISIAFTVTMLTDDAGEITGIAAIIRDETERFKEDRKLKKRLAQLEAEQE